jgi:hypothetical protein
VLVPELYVVVPVTTAPPGPVTANVVPVTAWLKPSATVAFWATLTAFEAGVCEVTVGGAAVVKFHETGVIGALPTAVAPDTVIVYVVDGVSATSGSKVAVVAAPFRVVVPDTGVPPAANCMTVDPATTARSKPADTVVPSATPVAFEAGVRVVTDGDVVVVVNDHNTGTIVPPAVVAPPETVTLYVVPVLSAKNGVNVAVLVVELNEVEPNTELPDAVLTVMLAPETVWSKPASTFALVGTAMAPAVGDCEITVGAAAVVNVNVSGVIAPLPVATAPDTVTV